jgi:N-acetylmuramoyl-L-alanine amidase
MLKINSRGMVEGVAVRPTPNKSGTIKPSLIVVHDTAGNIDNESSISWLCNPQAKASAHFVIDRAGKITQLASCEVNCWHAGKSVWKGKQFCNSFSIGIEHVNPGKMLAGGRTAWGKAYDPAKYGIQQATTPHHGSGYWMPYTEAQLRASMDLVLAIRDRYEIDEIAPHWEISPGRKVDTNPLFPLNTFRGRLEGRQDAEFVLRASPAAVFRQWPSFNASNRLSRIDDDGWFKPVKSGVFPVSGSPDEMPAELLDVKPKDQLWYQVRLEAAGQEDTLAWVWSGHVKEDRP